MRLNKVISLILMVILLILIFIGTACINKTQDNTITLRVVWVINEQREPITRRQQKLQLEKIKKFYFDEAKVNLEFKDEGRLKIEKFYQEEFDPLPKVVELEKSRFDFVKSDFNYYKETIIENLKRIKFTELKKLSHNQKVNSYEDIFEILKENYLKEIAIFKDVLNKEHSQYNSASDWFYILENTKKYDLIFTNEIILNDSYDPYSASSILNGAILPGFAVPGKAVISTALLKLYPQEYHDKIALYYSVHELGHALFYIEHSNSEVMNIMGLNRNTFWQDIERPKLTDKERDLINFNLLLREGKKLYERQDYTHAIEKYNEALTRDPNCYLCSYFISQVYCEMRDYDSCASYLELTTRLNPKWSLPYEILGDIYFKFKFGLKKGGLIKAIEKYKKAVEIDPSKIALRLKLATCYEQAGKIKDAEKEYLAIIKSEPTNFTALQALKNLGNKKGQK